MYNIYNRRQFKNINESFDKVSNVGNSLKEIREGWNTSVVGWLANGVVGAVGGVARSLAKIYKWGRIVWFTKNLLSKLNKEFLKALILFADRNRINLEDGTIKTENKLDDVPQDDEYAQPQDDSGAGDSDDAGDDEQKNQCVEELRKITNINDFRMSKCVISIKNRNVDLKNEIRNTCSDNHIKNYSDNLKSANAADKPKKQALLDSTLSNRKKLNKEILDIQPILEMIDKKEKDLKLDMKKKFDEIAPDFSPTGEFDMPGVDFLSYPKFLGTREDLKTDKIAIGDKFTYTNDKNERYEVIAAEKIGNQGGKFKRVGKPPIFLNIDGIRPEGFPNIAEQLIKTKSFLIKNYYNYNNMNDENKTKFSTIYKAYQVNHKIFVESYEKEKSSAKYLDKPIYESAELLLELQVTSNKSILPGKSVEGGDLKRDNMNIGDILTKKEKDSLTDPEIINDPISNINYGKIVNTIHDNFNKGDVSKFINKYNLEVIRLMAEKYFESDKQKMSWKTSVNKVYSYWSDMMEIGDADILKSVELSGGVDKGKLDDAVATSSGTYDISVSSEKLIDPTKRFKISSLGKTEVVVMFIYNGKKFILTCKNYTSSLPYTLLRVTNSLGVDSENNIVLNDNFEETFVKSNGLFIDNKNVSGQLNTYESYIMFQDVQKTTTDINKPSSAQIMVLNNVLLNDASNTNKLCLFDPKTKKNQSVEQIKVKPEIKIKVQFVGGVKNDLETETENLIKPTRNRLEITSNDITSIKKMLSGNK